MTVYKVNNMIYVYFLYFFLNMLVLDGCCHYVILASYVFEAVSHLTSLVPHVLTTCHDYSWCKLELPADPDAPEGEATLKQCSNGA